MNHADLAELYRQHGPRLYRVAVVMMRDDGEAEDVVQDVFASVAQSPWGLSRARDQGAYLVACVHHAAVKRIQRRRRRPAPVEPDALADAFLADADSETDLDSRVEKALARLPPDQRVVLALKVEGELTFEEIARTLGISLNTAASRYRYALDKLRDFLKQQPRA